MKESLLVLLGVLIVALLWAIGVQATRTMRAAPPTPCSVTWELLPYQFADLSQDYSKLRLDQSHDCSRAATTPTTGAVLLPRKRQWHCPCCLNRGDR